MVLRNRKFTTIIAAAALAFAAVSSAFADATVKFTYPSDVPENKVEITVYKGMPTSSSSAARQLAALEQVEKADAGYVFDAAGTYSYLVSGDKFYTVCKLFNITEDEVNNSTTKSIKVATGPIAGNGYEPCNVNLKNAPEDYVSILDARDKILCMWTDEIEAHFTTDGLIDPATGAALNVEDLLKTPAFTKNKKMHELSSQEDLDEFIADLCKNSNADGRMHYYNLGQTVNYQFNVPMIVFSANAALPEDYDPEAIAKALQEDGKLIVWEQSQIHPNEPAAGEGNLILMKQLCGDYGTEVLKHINIILIPRMNPDGSYLFQRSTYAGFDMNRDHTRLKAKELEYIHTAYKHILPEVVIDDHEYTFYGATTDGGEYVMSNGYDIEHEPASSLNNNETVNAIAINKFSKNVHRDLAMSGLRNFHYGTGATAVGYTVNNCIGRAYYGLFNSISLLVETRGIGGGRQNLARRSLSHLLAAQSFIRTAIENADEIRTAVANARQEVIDKGKTFNEEDKVVICHQASGATVTPYVTEHIQYKMDGTEINNGAMAMYMNDYALRSRIRPTAYIVPLDEVSEEVITEIKRILDNQGAEYYEVEAGTKAPVKRYYYIGAFEYLANPKVSPRMTTSFEAGLRAEQEVTFEKGALVVPMDQVAGNVIAMTFEPDVNDSNGYDGTLVQGQGYNNATDTVANEKYLPVIYHDTDNNYPIYRYEVDDPRTSLPAKGWQGDGGSSGCNTGFGMLVLLAIIPLTFRRKK